MSKSDAPKAEGPKAADATKVDAKVPKKKLKLPTGFFSSDAFRIPLFCSVFGVLVGGAAWGMGYMSNAPTWFMWLGPIGGFVFMFVVMWLLVQLHLNE